ncbi:MAG: WXG100 family type VII secretion target [Defluviitaleaceae bacterium]|nr:WXG100 family type VII secretion target [Defluviitaleaceae bacterium]
MATGGESKIDTKLFVTTADTVGTVSKELESCFQEWGKAMQGMRGYWQGDTSDDIKNVAEAVQRSASDLLRSLSGYRAAVNEIAGIYDNTEKHVQEKGKTLKFDRAMR